MGIFDQDPAFVNSNQNDFRLQWGSPCVDTGDPGSQYNNPDGTRADMGAFYYDQSVPVRVLLTPLNAPLQIPAGGGSFDFIIQAANSDNIAHTAIIWCEAILPGGATYDPVMGPASLNLPAGATLGRQRTQAVPGGAPMGPYLYAAWAVVGSDSSTDSFPFVKIGVGNAVNSDVSWDNFGEALSFDILTPLVDSLLPTSALLWNSPNPFNATTTIRFTLAQAGQVALTIYDLQGKVVAIPVSGRREAGNQSFTFNGSTLSSGVYIYRLETPDYSISKKMALVK